MSRGEAKGKMFLIMFGKNCHQHTPIAQAFEAEFPLLAERLREQKTGNYRKVAREMQLMESKIMVWGVLNDLLLEKKITCLSIHDSICCFEEDIKTVEKSMQKFFHQEMKFLPRLKVEHLVPQSQSSNRISDADCGIAA